MNAGHQKENWFGPRNLAVCNPDGLQIEPSQKLAAMHVPANALAVALSVISQLGYGRIIGHGLCQAGIQLINRSIPVKKNKWSERRIHRRGRFLIDGDPPAFTL